MSQMWEVVHRLVAEAGLRIARLDPSTIMAKGREEPPPKSLPPCNRSPILG